MEHFIVSARKYRPQTFKDVVGQQAITNTLKNAIANNHLAQALLFCGPRGVGKTSCARILAKRINTTAETKPDEDFAFNIFELDAASNNSVDDIRSLIDQVRIPPQVGAYKVYIIDEVHMLSSSAFNAFLKTLEEPPKHAIFILATTEKHKIIPTILSRCQIFDFKRISVTDARKHLVSIANEQGVQADEDALHIIAQKADGAMRDALSIFDRVVSFSGNTLTRKAVTENLNVLDYDTYFIATDYILGNNIPELLLLYNDILTRGFDGHHFIAGLASHFRDLMVCKTPATIHLLEVGDAAKKKYYEQSQKSEMSLLLKATEMANDCDLKYKTSRNQRLLVELCLMQLASITFDGEKKNDKHFIVPPTHYQGQERVVNTHSEAETAVTKASIQVTEQQSPETVVNHEVDQLPQTNTASIATEIVEETPTTPHITEEKVAQPDITVPKLQEEVEPPRLNLNKERVSGLSIKGLRKKKELQEKLADKKVDVTNLPTEPFTEIAMQAAWQEYVSKLIQQGERIIASNLGADTPILDGTSIQLQFPNETMKVEVERAQGPLLDFLKRTLNNYDIVLDIKVNEEAQRKYAYTPQEKYDKLKGQNPDIELLKKTFDLEL